MPTADAPPLARAVQELNFLAAVLQGGPGEGDVRVAGTKGISVTVLSGFLGAGKTTLLRRVLQGDHGRRIAVIVNDFGAVNLDALAVAADHGDVVELTNGCSCCTIGADFRAALVRIADAPQPPDHIMVEASGLSDPVALATLAAGSPYCGSVGIVTLVDAQAGEDMAGLPVHHLFTRQIEAAHLIVLTKTARVDATAVAGLTTRLAQRFPGRRIVSDAVLDPAMTFAAETLGARPTPAEARHDLSAVVTRQIAAPRRWSVRALEAHLAAMPPGILRIKGSIGLDDGTCAAIQCVGTSFAVTREPQGGTMAQLVLIGLREAEREWSGWADQLQA